MANEKRFVDLDVLTQSIEDEHSWLDTLNDFRELARMQPTIDPVHAAGGVYCRECRYLQQDTHGLWCFRDYENPLKLDGFCSYGERRGKDAVD